MTRAPAHEFAPWARRWTAALALVGGVMLARLVYLATLSPFALIEDEAFYWLWSQHPAWSYYTKGPGIALAIGASTTVLGDTEFGVRALAPVFAAALALAAAALARDVTRDGRAGFCAAALVTLAPGLAVAPLLMTIDVPYMACWALAALGAWRAVDPSGTRPARWWALCGVALGAGFLFKYTILLLIPGIALGALVARRATRHGPDALRWSAHARGLLIGTLLLVACMTPVVVWNLQHDWPTMRHLLGHLGVRGGDMAASAGSERSRGWRYDPRWTLEFVGIQLALAGPALLLAPLALRGLAKREPRERAGRWFLFCCAAPILVFYLLVTLKAEAEGNWALGALCTLLPLAGIAARDGLDAQRSRLRAWLAMPAGARPRWGLLRRRPETPGQVLWDWSIGLGVVVTVLVARVDLLAHVPIVGDRVPLGRLMVGRTVARDVAPLVERIAREDGPALVISQHYGRAAQLAFYLPGEVARRGLTPDSFVVLCGSSRLGGRTTDFDFWPDTSVDDPRWVGRDAVCLGATMGQWREVFERVEDVGPLPGDHKKRTAAIGRGFKGFAARAALEGSR